MAGTQELKTSLGNNETPFLKKVFIFEQGSMSVFVNAVVLF